MFYKWLYKDVFSWHPDYISDDCCQKLLACKSSYDQKIEYSTLIKISDSPGMPFREGVATR